MDLCNFGSFFQHAVKHIKRWQATEYFADPQFYLWRRHPDLNRRIAVLQTAALPLGYAAKKNGAGNGI